MGIEKTPPLPPPPREDARRSSTPPSPPPPIPPPVPLTEHEQKLARRRARDAERRAEKREEKRRAAEDRLFFGVPVEEICPKVEDPDAPVYCLCKQPEDGREMVCCEDEGCEIDWFHASCVGQQEVKQDSWICDACRQRKELAEIQNSRTVYGSLSQDDMDMIVPPPANIPRAPAGDVYGLSSWKEEVLEEMWERGEYEYPDEQQYYDQQQQQYDQPQYDENKEEYWEEDEEYDEEDEDQEMAEQ